MKRNATLRYLAWLMVVLLLAGCGEEPQESVQAEAEQAAEQPQQTGPVGDPELGRKLAQEQCEECHGMDGNKGKEDAPYIAGLDQQYIIRSMLAYTNGSRKHVKMQKATEAIKPTQIADVSLHYALQSAHWSGNLIERPKPIASDIEAVERGMAVAGPCDACHGFFGRPNKPDIPFLAAMQPEYFINSLKAYYNGERQNRYMAILEYMLTEQKIQDLAAYYSSYKSERNAVKDEKEKARIEETPEYKEGRELAMACAGCHGSDGNSPNPSIPSLAGQPSQYLFNATKAYRTEERINLIMAAEVQDLGDETIRKISDYYSRQMPDNTLYYMAADPDAFDPLEEGRRIASACDGCHGENGNSKKRGIPSLAGQPVKYLKDATAAYLDGRRQHKLMKVMAEFLDDVGIEKVALHYASQAPEPADKEKLAAYSDADRAIGAKLSESCDNCHGKQGVSEKHEVPSLAGQDAIYLTLATNEYVTGRRQHEGMQGAVSDISKKAIMNLAAYYEAQQPAQFKEVYIPQPPLQVIAERCDRCHGELGEKSVFDTPRLAGQSEPYLIMTLLHYADGTRKHRAMGAMSSVLSLIEIKGIAAYYARQQPSGTDAEAGTIIADADSAPAEPQPVAQSEPAPETTATQ